MSYCNFIILMINYLMIIFDFTIMHFNFFYQLKIFINKYH